METSLFIGCLLPSLSAIYTDLKYRKIYNWITIPLFLTGIGYALYTHTIIEALAGSAFAFVLFIICGLKTGMNGGDIKLVTALGAWFGYIDIFFVIVIGCLLVILWWLYNLYCSGKLTPRLKIFFTGILLKVGYRAKGVLQQLPEDDEILSKTYPFGVPLVIAAWVVSILS